MLATTYRAAIEEYLVWNEAIGSVLLDGRFASKPAYLQLEPHILEEVAAAAGHSADDDPRVSLVAAVRETLGIDQIATPFLFHISRAEQWEEKGRDGYPPCLGLLAVLVLASQDMISDESHAAHNYYGRLEQLLDVPPPLWARVRRHFSDTVDLWRGVNDWLEDWEGERGLPTAAVLDRRVYVGFPLSQALVRAADRARLHEAFLEYGLTPGRRIAAAEMRTYLGDWLTHQGASTRLGRMWDGGAEVRDRIVDIALGELAAWTGEVAEATEARVLGTQRLHWAAELRDGSLPVLDLYLTTRANEATIDGAYDVVAPSDEAARHAVAGCAEALRLDPLPGCDMASLEPWPSIGVASLLAGALRIRRRGEPATELAHSPNALIVLALDERDGWYREVGRAQLLEPCLVLAHRERAALVEAHLRFHARPGFRRLEAESLEGLAEGWVAFLDVTIVLPADEQNHPRIKNLCPAPANAISLSGGLRLGGSTWHVDAPPEAIITLERGTRLTLHAECRRKLTEDAAGVELGHHDSPAAVPLAGEGLEAGDYDLQVTDGRLQLLAHAGIRLRSADHPRPSREFLKDIGHSLGDGGGLVTATAAPEGAAIVSGAHLAGELGTATTPRLKLPVRPLMPSAETSGGVPARSSRPDRSMYRHACVAGVHYWKCDPGYMDETTRTLKRMQCRDCQREVWTVNRGRLPRGRTAARVAYSRPLAPPAMAAPDNSYQGIKPALDTLLDALTYARSGSWESLKQMAGALDNDPVFAWSAARTLSALGHIDLTLDPRYFRLTAWQIAPTTLVETGDGTWVLAGARSDRLVDHLDSLAGGSLSYEEEAIGPTVLRLRPMGVDAANAIGSALPSPLGGTTRATPRCSARIAAGLPLLRSLLPDLAVARMPSRGHELFDLESGRWRPAPDVPQAGAYRMELHGRLYGFADIDQARRGEVRVVDVLAAKHLAAASGGISLLGYDPDTRLLMTPMGAELPGLLHRVAALASGKAPQLHRQAGLTLYRDVEESVAAHLQRCLGIAG